MNETTSIDPVEHPLLGESLGDLMALAAARRDETHGTRVTYSPKVFIPLTFLCNDTCGYCTFAQPPAHVEKLFLEPDDVLKIAREGARQGCHEALFTLGERPEDRYQVARDWLSERGYDSTVHYVAAMAELVLRETGLLPHANAGALSADELARIRPFSPSQGMMIESVNRTSMRTATHPTRLRNVVSPHSTQPARSASRSPPASSSGSATREPISSPGSKPLRRHMRSTAMSKR